MKVPFWAKKKEIQGLYYWLPLEQHLIDAWYGMGFLWDVWLSNRQKTFLCESCRWGTGPMKEAEVKRFLQFIAFVHDIGKATPAFQTQKGYDRSIELDRILLEKLEKAGYTGISEWMLPKKKETHHTVTGQVILLKNGVKEDVASIVGGHHGRSLDEDDKEDWKTYTAYYFQEESSGAVSQKWDRAQQEILQMALRQSGFASVEDLPTIYQAGQVLIEGLVIMTDWMVSNESYFPLFPVEKEAEKEKDAERALRGCRSWKKDCQSDRWEPSSGLSLEERYQKRFAFSPRPVQRAFSEGVTAVNQPGIFIFEAPMGVGKTEAALVAVEQLAEKTKEGGLFFGLPTQATSNSMFERVNAWLMRVAQEDGGKLGIRLQHGKAALNETYGKLQEATLINPDEEGEGSVVVNAWFSGRKTALLDDFVVGTIDQFLLMGLKQKHLFLRHLGFSKKVVVIDEVHAYDAYMSQYLYRALTWLGVYQVPVIILSATLPAEKRKKMVTSYMRGAGYKEGDIGMDAVPVETDAYPLLTFTDGGKVKMKTDFPQGEEKEIEVIKTAKDIPDLLPSPKEAKGIIGVVVNTVKKGQALAQRCIEIYGEEAVELLHSRFIATHRVEKEKRLMEMIGKNGKRPKFKIIIGTQVIEQSLDIDFDEMVTELAPMDLLLQRMGRLHRHFLKRPKGLERPKLYVTGCAYDLAFDEGTVAVYDPAVLAKTLYLLPDVIRIPGDISPLVQRVYGEEPVAMPIEVDGMYQEMREESERRRKEKENKAKVYRIEEPVRKRSRRQKGTLIGWLKNASWGAEKSEEKAYAQVRDIEESLEMIALQKVGNGYGYFFDRKDISKEITHPKVAKKVATQTLPLPSFLTKGYNIEKTIAWIEEYNRKYLADWQQETWLKGALGLIFDEEGEVTVGDVTLVYDVKYGLQVKKERM